MQEQRGPSFRGDDGWTVPPSGEHGSDQFGSEAGRMYQQLIRTALREAAELRAQSVQAAERTYREMLIAAHAEAAEVRAAARREADELLAAARVDAEEICHNARRRVRAELVERCEHLAEVVRSIPERLRPELGGPSNGPLMPPCAPDNGAPAPSVAGSTEDAGWAGTAPPAGNGRAGFAVPGTEPPPVSW